MKIQNGFLLDPGDCLYFYWNITTGDTVRYSIIQGMAKRKANVSKERQVITYVELWHASHVMLEKAQKDQEGSFYPVMASLVFTAFMMEAYLNHVGPRLFECWDDLEQWLSPLSKLSLIAEKLGVKKDKGRRPYQTVSKVFKFRNSLAHGKSRALKTDNKIRVVDETFDRYMHESLKTEWESYCRQDNANRALVDTEAIIREFHKRAGIPPDFPFSFGMHEASATLLPEE